MNDVEQRTAKAQSLSDQCWAGLREHHVDIDRIAHGGLVVDDKRDRDIVRMVFSAVSGDLHLRAAQTEES